jgi:hypothetical protein
MEGDEVLKALFCRQRTDGERKNFCAKSVIFYAIGKISRGTTCRRKHFSQWTEAASRENKSATNMN